MGFKVPDPSQMHPKGVKKLSKSDLLKQILKNMHLVAICPKSYPKGSKMEPKNIPKVSQVRSKKGP